MHDRPGSLFKWMAEMLDWCEGPLEKPAKPNLRDLRDLEGVQDSLLITPAVCPCIFRS